MKEMLVAAIGIWLVFVLVFASIVGAQPPQVLVPAATGTPAAEPEVSGKTPSTESVGGTVLLEYGLRVMSPVPSTSTRPR